jgi:hypothetical protein
MSMHIDVISSLFEKVERLNPIAYFMAAILPRVYLQNTSELVPNRPKNLKDADSRHFFF